MLHLPESFYGKVRNKKKKILGGLICLVLLKGLICNKQVVLGGLGPDPCLLRGRRPRWVLLQALSTQRGSPRVFSSPFLSQGTVSREREDIYGCHTH